MAGIPYIFQGHTLNDLKISHWAPPLRHCICQVFNTQALGKIHDPNYSMQSVYICLDMQIYI
jgi:hypothetical protein